jgi:hypothetical protein
MTVEPGQPMLGVVPFRATSKQLVALAGIARRAGLQRAAREFQRAAARPGLAGELTSREAVELYGHAVNNGVGSVFDPLLDLTAAWADEGRKRHAENSARPRPGNRLRRS